MASNITVDGVPLEQVLDQEHRAEIQEVRVAETKVPLNRHNRTKLGTNLTRARAGRGAVVYHAGQEAQYVLICGTVFPWSDKAPYVRSGESLQGVIELKTPDGPMKCHECGVWFDSLCGHVKSHKITAREYKTKHGFRFTTKLISPRLKSHLQEVFAKPDKPAKTPEQRLANMRRAHAAKALIKHMVPAGHGGGYSVERANLSSKCKAQLCVRIPAIAADLGRCPTLVELEAAGITRRAINFAFNLPGASIRKALLEMGLDPRDNIGRNQYEALDIEAMRELRLRGLSQRAVARTLGVDRDSVRKYASL